MELIEKIRPKFDALNPFTNSDEVKKRVPELSNRELMLKQLKYAHPMVEAAVIGIAGSGVMWLGNELANNHIDGDLQMVAFASECLALCLASPVRGLLRLNTKDAITEELKSRKMPLISEAPKAKSLKERFTNSLQAWNLRNYQGDLQTPEGNGKLIYTDVIGGKLLLDMGEGQYQIMNSTTAIGPLSTLAA